MNKSIGFGVPIVVFLFIFTPTSAFGQQPQQQQYAPPTIVISQSLRRPITISFTTQELQQIDRDASLVLKKLGTLTTRDCSVPYRISSCVWSCKNGRKIRTCDPTLVKALERVWRK